MAAFGVMPAPCTSFGGQCWTHFEEAIGNGHQPCPRQRPNDLRAQLSYLYNDTIMITHLIYTTWSTCMQVVAFDLANGLMCCYQVKCQIVIM